MAAPQLYLVLEVGAGALDAAEAALDAALGAAQLSSVLLRPAEGGTLDARLVKPLVERIQRKGAAALIADDTALTRVVRADGVHLSWSKDQLQRYASAREDLGARYIVGADAGRSRDDAMSLGEDGADYVAFGIPPHVEDRQTAAKRQIELVSWWSEIFEVPCVGLDADDDTAAGELAASRADFVGVTLNSSMPAQACAERVAAFAEALRKATVKA